MITIDGRTYNVAVTDVGLDVEFVYKFAERAENFNLLYELGAVYYNQSLTFGLESTENTDFVDLFKLLSSRSRLDDGTGHDVELITPLGNLTFRMYPNKMSMSLKSMEAGGSASWWGGFTVKFIAVKPVERW